MAHNGPLQFERIDGSDLAVDHFSSWSDNQCVGDRAGPILVEGFGERVAIC